MTELKRCPFCGGKAKIRVWPLGERQITCGTCLVTPCQKMVNSDEGFEAMVATWNRRTPEPKEALHE